MFHNGIIIIMKLIKITDIKNFTKKLFYEDSFDQFLLSEGNIVTNASFSIDGHLNPSFYTNEEIDQLTLEAAEHGRIFSKEMLRWEAVKAYCFSIIKGKKTPTSFKFTMYLAPENVDKFLATSSFKDVNISRNDISCLAINIKYDKTGLSITTGTSLTIFTMDKTVENAWDNMIMKFLTSLDITYDI